MSNLNLRRLRTKRFKRSHALLIGMAIGALIFILAAGVWLGISALRSAISSPLEETPPAASATASLPSPLPPSNTPAAATATPSPSPSLEPSPTPTAAPSETLDPALAVSPTPTIYIVQSGDTLSGIAVQFGTSVELLKQANNLTSDIINIGQSLIITWVLPASAAQTPQPTTSSAGGMTYLVAAGDTLQSIAAAQGIEPGALRAANYMAGDAILPGQQLRIPLPGETPVLPAYQFSLLEGDLAAAYPLSWDSGDFTLHYAADSFTAIDPQAVSNLVANALANDTYIFQATLPYHFDVYTAGSVFAPPNRALRGRSFSSSLRYHFLHDGTGSATDQQYIAAHELTHLYTWNVFGVPVSVMLSEGAATYAGMRMVADSAHLPLDTFCAAYLQADALPYISTALGYNGHNIDLENYYAAGCFVGYLIEVYGPASFGALYPTGDYAGVYGQSLVGLEADWRAYTATLSIPSWLDANALVAQVSAVTSAYENFFPYFSGSAVQMEAYYHLDQARLALLEARLSDSAASLQTFYDTLSQP